MSICPGLWWGGSVGRLSFQELVFMCFNSTFGDGFGQRAGLQGYTIVGITVCEARL